MNGENGKEWRARVLELGGGAVERGGKIRKISDFRDRYAVSSFLDRWAQLGFLIA